VEIDDAALERYLGGEAIDLTSLRRSFIEAMNRGHVVPIVFTAAKGEVRVVVEGQPAVVLIDGLQAAEAADAVEHLAGALVIGAQQQDLVERVGGPLM